MPQNPLPTHNIRKKKKNYSPIKKLTENNINMNRPKHRKSMSGIEDWESCTHELHMILWKLYPYMNVTIVLINKLTVRSLFKISDRIPLYVSILCGLVFLWCNVWLLIQWSHRAIIALPCWKASGQSLQADGLQNHILINWVRSDNIWHYFLTGMLIKTD